MIVFITNTIDLVQLWHKPCGRWSFHKFMAEKNNPDPLPKPEINFHLKQNELRQNTQKKSI